MVMASISRVWPTTTHTTI